MADKNETVGERHGFQELVEGTMKTPSSPETTPNLDEMWECCQETISVEASPSHLHPNPKLKAALAMSQIIEEAAPYLTIRKRGLEYEDR